MIGYLNFNCLCFRNNNSGMQMYVLYITPFQVIKYKINTIENNYSENTEKIPINTDKTNSNLYEILCMICFNSNCNWYQLHIK